MEASKRKPGNGINGIKEPKKLTSARLRYPTSGANGNSAEKSTNHPDIKRYLTKSNRHYVYQNFFIIIKI